MISCIDADFRGKLHLSPSDRLFEMTRLKVPIFSYCRLGAEWQFTNHRQGFYVFYLILGGDGWVRKDGVVTPLKAGNAYFLPKTAVHDLGCETGVEMFLNCFSLTLYPGQDLMAGIDDVMQLGHYDLGMSAEDLVSGGARGLDGYFRIRALILSLLAKMPIDWDERLRTLRRPWQKYERMLTYVEQNLSADLRMTDLAEIMGMTPQSLSRAFRRDMGFTLKHYVLDQLNEQACSLLGGSELKVREIAHELGFNDEYHFSRGFSKAFGLSPTAYRKQFSGG